MKNTPLFRSGLVWLVAGVSLAIYATIGIVLDGIPGLEKLVYFLQSLTGWWILVAVFIAMFVEGLYFIGSFFPGSSIVVILAVLSQYNGWSMFVATICTIFSAWVLAGLVNIKLGSKYTKQVDKEYFVKDRFFTTWFPAFRANYEVAQMVSGGDFKTVFWSSVRVKFLASLFMSFVSLLLALTVDLESLSDEEGFTTLYYSAAIMIVVGVWQIRKSYKI